MIKKLLAFFKPKPKVVPNNDIVLLTRISELEAILNYKLFELSQAEHTIAKLKSVAASSSRPVSKRKRGRPSKKTKNPNIVVSINQPLDIKEADA